MTIQFEIISIEKPKPKFEQEGWKRLGGPWCRCPKCGKTVSIYRSARAKHVKDDCKL